MHQGFNIGVGIYAILYKMSLPVPARVKKEKQYGMILVMNKPSVIKTDEYTWRCADS